MPLPAKLDTKIKNAVVLLGKKLRCKADDAPTHRTLAVEGWADAPEMIEAIAAYLVGLLGLTIARTLEIRAQVEDTERDKLELVQNVERIVGADTASLSEDQKEDERNPWIAEGLWHLCLFLAATRAELHPLGAIVALDFPHVAAKDHGFDVMAIYRSGVDSFGVSFVESKAYANNPNKAINHAVAFFGEVDNGKHDMRLRTVVASMRSGMPAEQQQLVSLSLWKDIRAYVPNPHYDSAQVMDWTNARPSFNELRVPKDRILIMPHAISKFAQFFDDIAAAMRSFVKTL